MDNILSNVISTSCFIQLYDRLPCVTTNVRQHRVETTKKRSIETLENNGILTQSYFELQ